MFPEHASYKGDTVIHRHVDFAQYAIPVLSTTHISSGDVWHTK
ncbi:hypothetical protein [Providencia stuartii]|nr:hypothetical protein [Providencia stuartii]NPD42824.1 hypothetical protein [Providencia stuartii]NPD96022.1 hypothetical protein [Providencia stuartii]SUC47716.1 Uncharacterised protein [Providencia stuartii]HEM6913365.1 hypothetical protein [Providencia stuartii]HEM7165345.1 hypothetical protein [Providencia stuartii]